jgi:hypothetical protein
MRTILLIFLLFSTLSIQAQTSLPLGGLTYIPANPFTTYPSLGSYNNSQKKWSLSKYAGVSASFGFFNGGSATVFSAPLSLQLNRRLSNNLYAFAGVSAAPAFYHFNSSFVNSDINKNNPGFNRYGTSNFGMYSKFETGLMYINDDRTFSISGSIGVYRSSYPAYPYASFPPVQKQQPAVSSKK